MFLVPLNLHKPQVKNQIPIVILIPVLLTLTFTPEKSVNCLWKRIGISSSFQEST